MPYNKMKLAVGFFVISLITALSIFFYLILKEKGAFEKRFSYDFYAKSAAPFKIGMPLQFSGFDIGMIDNIQLANDGNVHLTFSVSKENSKWICKDSMLMLVKPLIGSPHIDVITVVGNPPLQPNTTLQLVESDDINDMISRLQPAITKMIDIINNIDIISTKFSQDDGALSQSMKNIEIVTGRLAQNRSLLTSITGDQGSTDALIGSLNETHKTMKQVHDISDKLDVLLSGLDSKMIKPSTDLLTNINIIMLDVQKKLKTLDGTVNAVGGYDKDLVSIKEQIQVGLDKTNKVMDKVDTLLNPNKKNEIILP
jgi:phospholipid/cholesterol/gamma-HCH transport system substrate-binding protein